MGRSKSFDEYLTEEPELRRVYDTDPEARRIIDTAKGLEGIVRNSSIHAAAVVIADRPLTDIVPLQLAEDRTGARGERRALLPHGHAVLDEADRGDRPAEDGLPRAAEPRRDRGGARHHRGVERSPARHDGAAARRPEDLRDARARRLRRRVPVRVRRHARRPAQGQAGRVQRPRGAGGALPPGRDALHRHLRAQQARAGGHPLRGRAPALDHRVLARGDPLPGAVDADREGDRRLLRARGGRPAQGDRQEAARPHGGAEGPLLRGRPRHRARRRR